jgi:hypothetical protein
MSLLRVLFKSTLGDRRHLAPVASEWILRAREITASELRGLAYLDLDPCHTLDSYGSGCPGQI